MENIRTMMDFPIGEDETLDELFRGRLKILQKRDGYRFSMDSVILARFARARSGDRVIDLGTGCGVISLIMALDGKVDGLFNLGWGIEVTDFEIFEAVRRAVGTDLEPIYDQVRPGEVYRVVLDASRAKSALGWEPEVRLEDGVKEAVEFYGDHLEW